MIRTYNKVDWVYVKLISYYYFWNRVIITFLRLIITILINSICYVICVIICCVIIVIACYYCRL